MLTVLLLSIGFVIGTCFGAVIIGLTKEGSFDKNS